MTFKGRRSDTFDVCDKPCDQCLFSSNKVVSEERKLEILSEVSRNDTHFLCHKHSIEGRDVVCHGDFSRDTRRTLVSRLANKLGNIVFIGSDGKEKK